MNHRTAAAVGITVLFLATSASPAAAALADGVPAALGAAGCELVDLMARMAGPEEVALTDPCTGSIRPGAVAFTGGRCTLNWVVQDETGQLYIGTAGHCGGIGQRVRTEGVSHFGTIVAREDDGVGKDWAWIRVDAAKAHLVSPTLCKWGGPTRDAPLGVGGLALQYGWGQGYHKDPETRARAFAAQWPQGVEWPTYYGSGMAPESASFTMEGLGAPGDSGSPVMSADGGPLGVLTHALILPSPAGLGVIEYGTRLDVALERGSRDLGVTLTLVKSDEPVSLV